MWDILIRGGTVIDGSGTARCARRCRDRGRAHRRASARRCRRTPTRVIDAGGLAVTPGFIDIKTHSDFVLPINPKAESKVRQGVTTEIIGHCGFSVAPVLPGKTQLLADYLSGGAPWLPFREMSFPDYLDTFPAVVGQCRDAGRPQHAAADGDGARRPRADRGRACQMMAALLDEGLGAGALGLLVGPVHAARQLCRAGRDDARCAKSSKRHKAGYFTHIRDESERGAGGGRGGDRRRPRLSDPCRDRPPEMLGRRQLGQGGDRARHDRRRRGPKGCDIDCDAYPYAAGANPLKNLLPPWVQVGGNAAMLARLAEPQMRARIDARRSPTSGLNNWGRIPSWEAVQVSISPNRPETAGKTVGAARRRARAPTRSTSSATI